MTNAGTCDETGRGDAAARRRVDAILEEIGRPLVALSGGVDSALLASRAARVGGAAATLVSPLFAAEEIERARESARTIGLPHFEVPVDALAVDAVRDNPVDRCYHCRKAGMGLLIRLAAEKGYDLVVDGENADDEDDYRPGLLAMRELGLRGPLREAGMTKAMIRRWAGESGLPTASTPAAACLATRIPFGTPLTMDALRRVEAAEACLRKLGPARVRVRDLDGIACIEVDGPDLALLAAPEHRENVVASLLRLGYRRVTLDLAGYRTGSLNPPDAKAALATRLKELSDEKK